MDDAPEGMKRCRICEVVKSLDDFHSHAAHKDGKQNYCKPCRNAENKRLLTPEQKERKKANSQRYAFRQAVHRRGTRYGLTPREFEAMRVAQGGRCAICLGEETYEHRELCVDHHHETGVVRGLLCTRCNKALGGFQDDPAILARAIEYLLASQHLVDAARPKPPKLSRRRSPGSALSGAAAERSARRSKAG